MLGVSPTFPRVVFIKLHTKRLTLEVFYMCRFYKITNFEISIWYNTSLSLQIFRKNKKHTYKNDGWQGKDCNLCFMSHAS